MSAAVDDRSEATPMPAHPTRDDYIRLHVAAQQFVAAWREMSLLSRKLRADGVLDRLGEDSVSAANEALMATDPGECGYSDYIGDIWEVPDVVWAAVKAIDAEGAR